MVVQVEVLQFCRVSEMFSHAAEVDNVKLKDMQLSYFVNT